MEIPILKIHYLIVQCLIDTYTKLITIICFLKDEKAFWQEKLLVCY